MMENVFSKLTDDNPITSISVIEDIATPPPGFIVVSKTHDQDSDADLWKAYNFFGRKISRYLCLSKEEKIADYIVENIGVIGEKDVPPDGYCLIPRTMDTDAKAWKKRQICYSLARRYKAVSAVTDVILLSKNRKAPQGFKLAGDINGLAVCFKVNTEFSMKKPPSPTPVLSYSLSPNGIQLSDVPKKQNQPSNGIYPVVSPPKPTSPGGDDYVNMLMPKRKAPPVPISPPGPSTSSPPPLTYKSAHNPSNYSTLGSYQGLEGVPFVLHPTLQLITHKNLVPFHKLQFKKKETLDKEYNYDFKLERQYT
ncbi:multivesicular body subunit 12A [Cimex lectularius]|uniref:Multivesicular body subunit 12A n=1 Tax=Cimex lectularius TaxID=79782 RepID=A0A8I6S4V9_CIMLE|nr:multivesicular body subunit 12A [Cimex lectularius]